jgi:hypothetical protein
MAWHCHKSVKLTRCYVSGVSFAMSAAIATFKSRNWPLTGFPGT